jgi:hypothetical protein
MRALDDATLRNDLCRDVADACDRASASAREYAESLTQTVEVLLARLDETERSVQRARDEARRGSAASRDALEQTLVNVRRDYALIDSIEDALRSIENALTSLERATGGAERAELEIGRHAGKALESVKTQFGSLFGKVGAITETWRMSAGRGTEGGETAAAAPTSPTSPGAYYFDDDDHDEGEGDARGAAGVKFGAAITANANKLASSLADGLSRFRLRATSRASASASAEASDADADANVAA